MIAVPIILAVATVAVALLLALVSRVSYEVGRSHGLDERRPIEQAWQERSEEFEKLAAKLSRRIAEMKSDF